MPAVTRYYVKGQKLAFPYGERMLSGPHETHGEADAECKRLRPLYPDANLSVVSKYGITHRQVSPRKDPAKPAFDLSQIGGRRAAARAIAEHCRQHGFEPVVEDWDGDPDVDVTTPSARANIWLGWTRAAPMPIISWVANSDLQFVSRLPGAWDEGDGFSNRKATSLPATWPALLDALIAGLCASIDGTAFK